MSSKTLNHPPPVIAHALTCKPDPCVTICMTKVAALSRQTQTLCPPLLSHFFLVQSETDPFIRTNSPAPTIPTHPTQKTNLNVLNYFYSPLSQSQPVILYVLYVLSFLEFESCKEKFASSACQCTLQLWKK